MVAAAAVVAALVAGAGAALPTPNAVTYWSEVAEKTISAGSRPPASSQVLSGVVHSAIYDAVAATEEGLEPFMVAPSAANGALPDAAVAKAAHDVLVARVPAAAQVAAVDLAYTAFMAGIPDSQAKTDGVTVGADVTLGTLALRAGDRFDTPVPWEQPAKGPGVFEPISVPPVDLKLKQLVPSTRSARRPTSGQARPSA